MGRCGFSLWAVGQCRTVLDFRARGLVSVIVIEATVYKQRERDTAPFSISHTVVPFGYVSVCVCGLIFQQARAPTTLLNPSEWWFLHPPFPPNNLFFLSFTQIGPPPPLSLLLLLDVWSIQSSQNK